MKITIALIAKRSGIALLVTGKKGSLKWQSYKYKMKNSRMKNPDVCHPGFFN